MEQKRLLIVDDEPDNRDYLRTIFADGYEVHLAADGIEALDKAREVQPHLILLDILMPRMDGLQACLRLRQSPDTAHIPIVFLTSRTEPETETFGLDLGADDYIFKPFNVEVLRARVKKRLGEGVRPSFAGTTTLEDYEVHWERQEAWHGERRIPLTTKEISLLRVFVQNPGRVLSRNVILEKIWAETYITDRTIDSHVKELRKKIPPLVRLLKTVYGAGYLLDI